MKILMVHNEYQHRGGEDTVLENEINLLIDRGHQVHSYIESNTVIDGWLKKLLVSLFCSFSFSSYFRFRKKLKSLRPDIVHVHNYFPLITPSVFFACASLKIPVVHTLHNFRSVCPSALLMHNGVIIEESLNGNFFWAIKRRVYRNSTAGSVSLTLMVMLHRAFGTWNKKVTRYIALTQFAKTRFVKAGWDESKISVKPNFIGKTNCEVKPSSKLIDMKEPFALYVGRLSEEKGIKFILDSWSLTSSPIVIIGNGPLEKLVRENALKKSNIVYLGARNHDEVREAMFSASFLVMASTWYEGLPMVLIEAFSCGKPAVVPDLGGMGEVVVDGYNGLKYTPKVQSEFLDCVKTLFLDQKTVRKLGQNAVTAYEEYYSIEKNYLQLIDIYKSAIREVRG